MSGNPFQKLERRCANDISKFSFTFHNAELRSGKLSKKARPQAGTEVTYAAIRLRRKLLP